MPKRLCREARCPDVATYRGYCQRHARARDKAIPRAGRHIYNTKRWKFARRAQLAATPLCEYVDPDEGPCMNLATDVHHRIALEDGGAPFDPQNLESLCHAHHSRHTRAEQTMRGVGEGRA